MLALDELFTPGHTRAWEWLRECEYPWQIIPQIEDIVLKIGSTLDSSLYEHPSKGIWIAKSAVVSPSACIIGPAIIGENTEVRVGAFIRSGVLVGDECVIGNSAELKNCILSDRAQVSHLNYVGDSVLGFCAHMGGGAITSNFKSLKTEVVINDGARIPTGLLKFGVLLGDHAELGCNSVTNPGTIIGAYTIIYPLTSVRGIIPSYSIVKNRQQQVIEKLT